MNQIENFALSRECSSRKNAPVFFLFSSLLHFSSGSTMYIGRAKFFEKRENANKTDGKIQKIPLGGAQATSQNVQIIEYTP